MDRTKNNSYRCLVIELLYGLKYMNECEYIEMIKDINTWETRELVAELKDIADGNVE